MTWKAWSALMCTIPVAMVTTMRDFSARASSETKSAAPKIVSVTPAAPMLDIITPLSIKTSALASARIQISKIWRLSQIDFADIDLGADQIRRPTIPFVAISIPIVSENRWVFKRKTIVASCQRHALRRTLSKTNCVTKRVTRHVRGRSGTQVVVFCATGLLTSQDSLAPARMIRESENNTISPWKMTTTITTTTTTVPFDRAWENHLNLQGNASISFFCLCSTSDW